jgi:hypothetical protein
MGVLSILQDVVRRIALPWLMAVYHVYDTTVPCSAPHDMLEREFQTQKLSWTKG